MISTANDISGAILGILGAGGKLGKFHFMTGINDGNFINSRFGGAGISGTFGN